MKRTLNNGTKLVFSIGGFVGNPACFSNIWRLSSLAHVTELCHASTWGRRRGGVCSKFGSGSHFEGQLCIRDSIAQGAKATQTPPPPPLTQLTAGRMKTCGSSSEGLWAAPEILGDTC